ncbi:MAG: peptidoglycan bridge formation glycyltransferase FemA/FemB family protein [Candidatus Levybacteria bacterium]|nr:peptidoglycan bridge formation glycyltransferase FemA/FemB family protein [Candidatus Levybacteria bacterium]MDZ4228497.1 peptidoglycan bridge formation glycyltransferase FemA/FemB family protein [Candidatus Levybacteria bacterium]
MKDDSILHPLQSTEWGDFRKKTGIKVVQIDGIQMTIHKIPYTPWTIGYIPKGPLPTPEIISKLKQVGKQEKCILIQLEPNITTENLKFKIENLGLHPAAHPLFTKYTLLLDLTKSEEELLKGMRPKTRYNIRVAIKHGVKIVRDDSDEAFQNYLNLTEETIRRQKFYAHTQKYHRLMWETLKSKEINTNKLIAHLFLAKYKEQTLAAWILFVYKDTLYYPYGASSNLHRETMASNLLMWEAIKFGKKLGLKKFDMWGALSSDPDKNDPWYGFHRFKEGYGPKHIEFVGSFDLVVNPLLYAIYKIMDKIRWIFLRIRK